MKIKELNIDYHSFMTRHSELVKEETAILKQEMQMIDQNLNDEPIHYVKIV